MANSSITVHTQPVTRNKLAQFLQGQELIRLIENLVVDVSVHIPTTTDALQAANEDNQAIANLAQAIAVAALALAAQANEGPPAPAAARPSDDTPPAPVLVLPEIPEDLTAKVASLEARLATAERTISELREGPSP